MTTPNPALDRAPADEAFAPQPGPEFKAELLAALPALRAFARGMCGNRDLADDMVQESIVKAWAAHASFRPDSHFRAWIFRILRNQYYNYRSREARLTPWDSANADHDIAVPASQETAIAAAGLQAGLLALTPAHREIVMLAAAEMSIEAIAEVVGCALGTVKSRLWRARRALRQHLAPIEAAAPRVDAPRRQRAS